MEPEDNYHETLYSLQGGFNLFAKKKCAYENVNMKLKLTGTAYHNYYLCAGGYFLVVQFAQSQIDFLSIISLFA